MKTSSNPTLILSTETFHLLNEISEQKKSRWMLTPKKQIKNIGFLRYIFEQIKSVFCCTNHTNKTLIKERFKTLIVESVLAEGEGPTVDVTLIQRAAKKMGIKETEIDRILCNVTPKVQSIVSTSLPLSSNQESQETKKTLEKAQNDHSSLTFKTEPQERVKKIGEEKKGAIPAEISLNENSLERKKGIINHPESNKNVHPQPKSTDADLQKEKIPNDLLNNFGKGNTKDHESNFHLSGKLREQGTKIQDIGLKEERELNKNLVESPVKRTTVEGNFKQSVSQYKERKTDSIGTIYAGDEFLNGLLHGQGKITEDSGTVREGTFQRGVLNGQGKITYANGSILEGEFNKGQLHGLGKLTGSEGTISEGTFRRGSLNGQGKITFANGDIWEGEFKNGVLHGPGTSISANGTVSEGTYQRGSLNGQGKITHPNGNLCEGEFNNGQLHGQGKITHPNGNLWEGEFKYGQLHGSGKIIMGMETRQGLFQFGKLHGLGTVIATGSWGYRTEGNFQNDDLNGQGKKTFSDGKVHQGEFKNNKLHGQGTIFGPSGEVLQRGMFEEGVLVRPLNQSSLNNTQK